jgi:hypothetical protein
MKAFNHDFRTPRTEAKRKALPFSIARIMLRSNKGGRGALKPIERLVVVADNDNLALKCQQID